ncbi:HAMP domain-containing histidine kinase [Aggregicoccus sp. 17bor-14]|uniref:sensor histidine kinase n=1 Tax=Myxococcaceae TaxID=31 RepID=UPI00129C8386|nr:MULTISPECIES: HAMP domain-containing sensor histidine kinase [Myxococcaceae]MBF5043525.1 HAMP domain-containing histidine kinase [Simulacricoccus sp. 17bor-14]MRI89282.1 HAMP domain-containing histidine kinase [Aggregicoccus sp. 17bor-14]
MRLRTFVVASTCALLLLGVGSAVGLAWATLRLQQQASRLADAIVRVRAADDLKFSLFLVQVLGEAQRAGVQDSVGPPVSVETQRARVHEQLRQVERLTRGAAPDEQVEVAAVRAGVERYLAAPPETERDRLRECVAAADALVRSSTEHAEGARADAQGVQRRARVIGGLFALSLVLGAALALLAARTGIFRPLGAIRHALAAFRSGQRELHVDQEGPLEVREIAAEFNQLVDTLNRADARQLQFLAGVAHDLRTPLNALKLSAQVLLRAPALPPPERVREALGRISAQIDRLERMVGDLLDRTRIEAGNLELRPEACDLRALLAEVVELHRPSSPQHELALEAPDARVPLRCDPTRISQVLTNLLSNAIKYSPGGGTIRVRLELEEAQVSVSVTDPGLGVPPHERERIFEPFKRSSSRSAEIPGVGLGLSVSRRIARAHGGELEVQDAGDAGAQGSTFRLRLPRAGADALPEPEKRSGREPGDSLPLG